MLICTILLLPFYLILWIVTQVIQQIVTTVCNWVSTIIATVIAIVNKICGWLPWPLNKLCKWIVTLITVIQTIWDYICNTIIQTIINIIVQIIVILIWLVRLICYYLISFPLNLPYLILCLLGLKFPKYIKVCIKILTDSKGNPAVTFQQAMQHITWANEIYKNCELELIVCDVEFIQNDECINKAPCSTLGIFSKCFSWFTKNTCSCCSSITIYFVNSIEGNALGCAYPGTNWVLISPSNDPAVLAQEIGHLAGLGHKDGTDNFMCSNKCITPSTTITKYQCCVLRNAPFTSVLKECV